MFLRKKIKEVLIVKLSERSGSSKAFKAYCCLVENTRDGRSVKQTTLANMKPLRLDCSREMFAKYLQELSIRLMRLGVGKEKISVERRKFIDWFKSNKKKLATAYMQRGNA